MTISPSLMDKRCYSCFLKTYERLFKKFKVNQLNQRIFLDFFDQAVSSKGNLSSPEMQNLLNRQFCDLIGIPDPFLEEKAMSNRVSMGLYSEWKVKVASSSDPFEMALKLAIAGNIMDYGAGNSFSIHKTIKTVFQSAFAIDHSSLLKERTESARKILYLGDNAGEIVFDKLFIETINHPNLIYAVKGGPVLNDVTMIDAQEVGMHKIAKVISNGYDSPSTVLDRCSDEFRDVFYSSDLIISKGQGNLEGLINAADKRIFFLLMAKCDLIAELLKVEKGSFIVLNMGL
jgi:damage-control phosphatase, subfamily I